MKKIYAAVLLFIPYSLFAVEAYFTFENDTLLERQDNDYTHGTGLEVVNAPWHYKVGQNIYTPSDLRRADHIKGDRPYAGFLYGGLGYEFGRNPVSPWTNYGELDFGVICPGSMSRYSQEIIHKLLDCREPKGWDNQLHNEFVVNVQWWTKYNWYLCEYAALVPRIGILAGTVQDAGEIGCDLKIGWHLRNDIGNQIMFSAPARRSWLDDFSVWAFVGCGERYYIYNHLLEGSIFNDKDKDLKVDIEPFVFEWRFGAAMQFRSFFIYYYGILRTDEYRHQKHAPDYGGLCIGWIF